MAGFNNQRGLRLNEMLGFGELNALLGLEHYQALDRQYGEAGAGAMADPTREKP